MKALAALLNRIDWSWPTVSLRSHLLALILLATLPIASLMGYWIFTDVQGQQQRMQLELQQSANSLALVVERELASSIDALSILAETDAIQRHDIAGFERALRGGRPRLRTNWLSVYLLDRDGKLLFDTATTSAARPRKNVAPLAFKPPAFPATSAESFPESLPPAAARSPLASLKRPDQVSALLDGRAPDQRAIAIEVPVTIAGQQARYRLGAWIAPTIWQQVLKQAALPAGAVAGIYDREQRLIASSQGAERPLGGRLPEALASAMGTAAAGVVHRTSGGPDATYDAWKTIALAGWVVDVGVPAAALDARYRQAIGAALAAAAACLLLGVVLALLVARRLIRPLHQLASNPQARAEEPIAVREVAQLRDALLAAKALEESAHARADARLAGVEQNLRESQRLMDLAEEAGHVGFFHYLFASDTLAWTPGLSRLFGLQPAARESTLADFLARIVGEHRERIEDSLRRAYAARQEKETLEFRVVLPGGAWRWLSSRILVNYGADGRPLQMIGVTLDIDDHKEAEHGRAALVQREHAARIEAEAANRAKDEFLAMLGHELRNPLSAIAAAVEVLNHVEAGADTALSARGVIARQTRHLAHLMDDLLDVARVISGKILLTRQRIDLAPLVERLVATMKLTGSADRHQLNVELADVWIDADATRIEQVVNNLLTNALKYTPAGGRIDVRVGSDGDQAMLEVCDTGVGIPPALLPKIFDLFVQAERTLDRRAGGLGIGLTLVRRLVELHGGTVAATSSAAGSVFTVRLPAVEAPAGAPARQLVPASRRRRVGVIEDNEDALDTLHRMLELDGHSVWCASDGVSGLNSLLERRPDVALVDIGLPGLTGLEVAKRSRAAGYAGRMIALSGYAQDNVGEQALAAGFDAYLVKPVDADQLRRLLADD